MYPNLKAEMARYGVTQGDIAQKAGVSKKTVWTWVNGGGKANVDSAILIRDEFFPNQPVSYLFGELEVSNEPVG